MINTVVVGKVINVSSRTDNNMLITLSCQNKIHVVTCWDNWVKKVSDISINDTIIVEGNLICVNTSTGVKWYIRPEKINTFRNECKLKGVIKNTDNSRGRKQNSKQIAFTVKSTQEKLPKVVFCSADEKFDNFIVKNKAVEVQGEFYTEKDRLYITVSDILWI